MSARRHDPASISLPGVEEGRRSFLAKGVVGVALLALGGGTFLATRRTRPIAAPDGPFRVFSREEAAVLLAIADRFVPDRAAFPRPRQVGLPAKMDAVAAMADGATQKDLRRLVRLFESPLAGLVLDGQPRLFTEASPQHQDERLAAWADSRIALRRTGYRALKRLVYATYYASPETWPAIGYPGPPIRVATSPSSGVSLPHDR